MYSRPIWEPSSLLHFVDLDFGMVDRQAFQLVEAQAVQFFTKDEDPLFHVLQGEIGAQQRVVEGVFFLAQFFGVMPPVPRGQLEAAFFAVDDRLHFSRFISGPFQRRCPQLLQEGHDRGRVLGHVFLQDEMGVGGVTEQLGPVRRAVRRSS